MSTMEDSSLEGESSIIIGDTVANGDFHVAMLPCLQSKEQIIQDYKNNNIALGLKMFVSYNWIGRWVKKDLKKNSSQKMCFMFYVDWALEGQKQLKGRDFLSNNLLELSYSKRTVIF